MLNLWKERLQDRHFRFQFLLTFFLLIVSLFLLTRFMIYVEQRPGIGLNDPVLALFEPIDLTWLTFALIYASLSVVLFQLLYEPPVMVAALQAYIIMSLMRMSAIYLVPLDPPVNMILLKDPLVEMIGTQGVVVTRDLFFSGHTATFFLTAYFARGLRLKVILSAGVLLVGLCVIAQHVHYTVDVFAAPVFAYAAVRLQQNLFRSEPVDY